MSGNDPIETVVLVPPQRRPPGVTNVPPVFAGHSADLWERPAPPEPLDAPWLRQVAWIVPALLALLLGGLGSWIEPADWQDSVAAPYYGDLLRWWDEVVGGSAVGLRAPSIVAMAAAAAVTAVIGERIGGLRVGVVAGFLVAVLPSTTRWAQEPGPVAVAILLAAASTFLLRRLLDRCRPAVALGYTVLIALLGATAGVATWLVLGGHAVAVAADVREGRIRWLWGLAALLGGSSAAVPVLLGDGDPLPGGRRLSLAATSLPQELFGGVAVAGAVLMLAVLGVALRRSILVVTLWALVPVVTLLAASAFIPVWSSAHLLVTIPAWALLAAVALRRFTLARGVSVALAVALLGLPAQVELRGPADAAPAVVSHR